VTSNNTPMLDVVQNLEDVTTGRNNTFSYARFTRALNTGDDAEDKIIGLVRQQFEKCHNSRNVLNSCEIIITFGFRTGFTSFGHFLRTWNKWSTIVEMLARNL